MNARLAAAIAVMACASASAQVYRCDQGGKAVYSDAPCLGAKRVDVTPTQGVDKLSGTSRKGRDVQRDEHQTQMAKALKPLLGETPEQYKTRHRRGKLTPREQQTCYQLDKELPALENAEAKSKGDELQKAQNELFQKRSTYKGLGC